MNDHRLQKENAKWHERGNATLRDRSEVVGLRLWEMKMLRTRYIDHGESVRAEARAEGREMTPLELHQHETMTDEVNWLNAKIKSIEAGHRAEGISSSDAPSPIPPLR